MKRYRRLVDRESRWRWSGVEWYDVVREYIRESDEVNEQKLEG